MGLASERQRMSESEALSDSVVDDRISIDHTVLL